MRGLAFIQTIALNVKSEGCDLKMLGLIGIERVDAFHLFMCAVILLTPATQSAGTEWVGIYVSIADSKLMQFAWRDGEVSTTSEMSLPKRELNGFPLKLEMRPNSQELYIVQAAYGASAVIVIADRKSGSLRSRPVEGVVDYGATSGFSADGKYLLFSGFVATEDGKREEVLPNRRVRF